MDRSVYEVFGNYGLAGILLAVLISFAWAVIQTAKFLALKQIEAAREDLQWFRNDCIKLREESREELAAKRQEFTASLVEIQHTFTQTLQHLEQIWMRHSQQMAERLEAIEQHLGGSIPRQNRGGSKP